MHQCSPNLRLNTLLHLIFIIGIDYSRLDEGGGVEDTLRKNKAKWHKSCYNNCSKLKYERALRKRKSEDNLQMTDPVKTRAQVGSITYRDSEESHSVCFFCEEMGGTLHKAATLAIDTRVRSAATQLQDRKLLTKLASGDMHAIDAVYHASCLAGLYNRVRKMQQTSANENEAQSISLEAIALAELVSYIEENRQQGTFVLSNLVKLYSSTLKELGAAVPERINSTRVKERLQSVVPDLKSYNDGKEVRLAFSHNINAALELAENHDFDAEAVHLAKTASIIRRELLKSQPKFNGSFDQHCQRQAVPASLLALVSMILEGSSIKKEKSDENEKLARTAALTISQLLIFNAINRKRATQSSEESVPSRHSIKRETPLPLYLGLVIHAETRKKQLVDKFYRLGLSVSYDRVLQVSTDLGNGVCALYEEEGVVCPPKLRRALFTTGNVDNIDHNTSSRTAKDSFHGTAITLTQHPTEDTNGIDRNSVLLDPEAPKTKVLSQLPESYTDVQPVAVDAKKDRFVPVSGKVSKPATNLTDEGIRSEYHWLNKVKELLDKEKLEKRDYMSWSAHFASLQEEVPRPAAITGLLPLFSENAHTAAMIQHSMKVIKQGVNYVNPEQTPIICMDQPLFALAKQIQWVNADLYGEDKYVVMMGGLHIEMASLKMVGTWLSNSGWDAALVQAEVTTSSRKSRCYFESLAYY
jgi:hypothetical protein